MAHRINAEQLLVSKENLMGKYSDIIDGYLRIESIDVLKSIGEIDRLNEFSVYCGCSSINNKWIKRTETTGISLITTGMTYSFDWEKMYDQLADDQTALNSTESFLNNFTDNRQIYTSNPGNPWENDGPLTLLTNGMKDFGITVVDEFKIGLIVFFDNSCC